MEMAQPRRAFQTLDGLRGVGAFLVVMRHVPAFFGPIQVPESFLAVDLFYLVSGFVVAHAYGDRLRTGGFFRSFVKTRLIRLYPLYLFGLALGAIPATIAVMIDPAGWWTSTKLLEAVVTGLVMIPLFPGLAANGSSLDGPTWTLLPELVANVVYALAIRFMTVWVLAAIVIICGAGLVVAEFQYGALDVGYNPTDQWAALARVGFSFFAGVLAFRLFGEKKRISSWAAWACVAVLTVALAYSPPDALVPYYELGVVLVGFPALLIVAGRFEPGALSGRLFSFIGLVSYGVYILHKPLGNLVLAALNGLVRVPADARGLLVGAAFLVVLVGLSWGLDTFYDAPIRRWLRARVLADRGPPSPTGPRAVDSAPETP
jgi:peptidoglycan/LPS O-acetylase OafA/YrhL